jgi:hypothetical protein
VVDGELAALAFQFTSWFSFLSLALLILFLISLSPHLIYLASVVCLFVFLVLRVKPKNLCMLDKHSTNELHPQFQLFIVPGSKYDTCAHLVPNIQGRPSSP